LLDTIRLETGRLSLDFETVSADEISQQALAAFRNTAAERNIVLEVVRPDPDIAVRADPVRVSQILGNLLGNAIKFVPPGGRVTLHVVGDGPQMLFHVKDNGPGIRPADLEQIFDRFWQGRRGEHGGLGLGLTIAKALVEAHGGRIWVEST